MRALLLAAVIAAAAMPALAGAPVTLRADPADADGKVTLGDLFDGAGAMADVTVATRSGPSLVLDAGMVQVAAHRAGLDWSNDRGLRRIIVRAGAAAPSAASAAKGGIDVLTWGRSMNAGEVVQASDLVWAKLAGNPADAPSDSAALVGMEVRRPLRAGAAAGLHDVSAPMVIKTGDMVEVRYNDGGVSLTLQAKALGPAAAGQLFAVENPSSKKVLQALAQAPGVALVGPAAVAARAPVQLLAAR